MIRCISCVLVAAAAAGCQAYAPKPLDADAHRAEWSARTTDAEPVREFAARLAGAEPMPRESAEGLLLAEAEIVAMVFNPELRSARARAAVALASAEHAGLWDDPSVSADVVRIVESVPDPWVIGGAVSFTIPLSGRLPVEKARANAEYELELRRIAEREWSTVASMRQTWAEWSATRMQIEILRELVDRVDAILVIVDRLEAAGTLTRLEGRLFRMERASRRSELILLESRAEQAELDLKSRMGLLPEARVSFIPRVAPDSPDAIKEPDDLYMAVVERSPAVAARRAAYEVAEHALHLEIRRQYPDLQIGPAAEWDEGQTKIGLGGALMLPLLNANRQGIAVAQAEREAARVEFESTLEQQVSALRQAMMRHQSAIKARGLIEHDLLPLAEAQIAEARRIAELGDLDVLLTLESMVRTHEVKARLIDARLDEALAAFRVRELLGPAPNQSNTEDSQ